MSCGLSSFCNDVLGRHNPKETGKKLGVSAQLVNVSDGLNIWSKVYDRNIEGIFAIQDQISWAIVKALENKLAEPSGAGKQLAKANSRNPDAYLLYLRGRYHLAQMHRPEIDKSMRCFAKAIEKDPRYALAYAGMAEAYNLLGNSNFSPPREVMPKAKTAAMKALAMDESLAEAPPRWGLSMRPMTGIGRAPSMSLGAPSSLTRAMYPLINGMG